MSAHGFCGRASACAIQRESIPFASHRAEDLEEGTLSPFPGKVLAQEHFFKKLPVCHFGLRQARQNGKMPLFCMELQPKQNKIPDKD